MNRESVFNSVSDAGNSTELRLFGHDDQRFDMFLSAVLSCGTVKGIQRD